ncbi:MAG: hypothetical protein IJZ29_00180 [Clostridia bacterium]|nr:hypothetical protein [Clostridia bacterium]
MNKKDFNTNFSYFFKAILIAFIPIMVIMIVLTPYVSELVLWLITLVLVGATLLIAYVIRLKKKDEIEEKEKKKKDKFDPYAD